MRCVQACRRRPDTVRASAHMSAHDAGMAARQSMSARHASHGLLDATIAKKILRMRVVGPEAKRPSLGAIVVRNICKPVEMMWPLLPIFMLWPLFARYRRRAGDMLAGTAVVACPPVGAAFPPAEAGEDDGSGDDSAPPQDTSGQ